MSHLLLLLAVFALPAAAESAHCNVLYPPLCNDCADLQPPLKTVLSPPATHPTSAAAGPSATLPPVIKANSTGASFYINLEPLSAAQAELGCQRRGGHLATFTTLKEQQEVGAGGSVRAQLCC